MWPTFQHFVRFLFGKKRRTISCRPRVATYRPRLETLEDRTLLSNYTAGTVTELIGDINAANTTGGTNTITLTAAASSPYILDNTTGALPEIVGNDKLTINTIDGANRTIERSSSASAFSLFAVDGGASLTLQNLTLTGGLATGFGGGAIDNFGILAINNCTLADNSAFGSILQGGGGIFNEGTANISNSTLVDNSAPDGYGGGIFNDNNGTVNVNNSTVVDNSAVNGEGGGICSFLTTTLNVSNSTIADNTASYGGGILCATANISNSIVAMNKGDFGTETDLEGTFTSQGYNLIGVEDSASSGFSNGINGDIVGTTANPVDPKLASLANYGGPTQTMALLPGSPAIDAGSNALIPIDPNSGNPYTTDQRGQTRIIGSAVDIGAFESQGFTLTTSSGSNQSADANTNFTQPLTVKVTANNPLEPVDGGVVTFTAPSSGASATLSANSVTISGGSASVTAAANGTRGAYTVIASVGGASTPASFTLTNTSSVYTASTVTELNDDINAANAAGGANTITLTAAASSPYILDDTTGTLPEITANDNLTINTIDGANRTIERSSSASAFRLFTVDSGASLTLQNLALTGGLAQGSGTAGDGGAIYNVGILAINNCTLADNTADFGGGIYNLNATANVSNSTLSGNSATTNGGGIFNANAIANVSNSTLANNSVTNGDGGGIENNGTVNISNSTLTSNSADFGGGIENNGTVNISNSTLSGNSAGFGGGGIYNSDTVNVSSSTLADNTATYGGGIENGRTANVSDSTLADNTASVQGGGIFNFGNGTVKVSNSIVATNKAPSGGTDVYGFFTSLGNNLIGAVDGSTGFTNGVNGDIVGTAATPLDPKLGSLADNGGPTQTMALLPGSPAIDAGSNALIPIDPSSGNPYTTDQRGQPRIVGSAVDIGAFESQATAPPPVQVTFNEFPLPNANSGPNHIVAGPDGNVWFNETNRDTLGEISPTGQVTEVQLPVPDVNAPFLFGPDGNIWLGLQTSIAEITPQGVLLHDYAIPSASPPGIPDTYLLITMGPDGNIWYTEPYTNDLIGRLTPDGQITEFAVPGGVAFGNDGVCEIIPGPDGNIWFEATAFNAIGRVNLDGSSPNGVNTNDPIDIFNLPPAPLNDAPRGLTVGPDNNLWMTDATNGAPDEILRVNTQGQLTGQFAIPTANSGAYDLTVGSDGALWFTEYGANQIGRITTDGNITEIPVPTGHIWSSITKGPDGNIWFSELDSNSIGEVVLNQPLAPQSITFGALADQTYGDADFALTATASSGLPVSYSATGDASVYQDGSGNWFAHITGAGSATITATQAGNGDFSAATPVSQSFNIDADATTTALTSSANPSIPGQTVALTATVGANAPGLGTPTGSVDFFDTTTNTDLGSVTLSGGVASLTTSALAQGSHVITATYSGDGNFQTSNTSLTQIVNTPPTAAVSGPSGGVLYQTLTFTLGASDPSPTDQGGNFTYAINWGDNTSDPVVGPYSTTATHAYTNPGTYTVTLTATDQDGNVSPAVTQQVSIVATPQLQNGVLALPGTATPAIFTLTPTLPTGASTYSMKVTQTIGTTTTNLGTFAVPSGIIEVYGGSGTNAVVLLGTANTDAFTAGSGMVNELAAQGTAQATSFTVGLNAVTALTLKGAGGSDSLTGPNQTNAWAITASNAGTLDSFLSFTGIESLIGGSTADDFAFTTSTASVSGSIDGGGGANTLDFSARGTPITVNLATGNTTGIGGGWTNIATVIGSNTATLIGANTPNVWDISGTNSGSVNNTLAFANFQNLTGGSVNDTFTFLPGGSLSGNLKGGAPINTLDYSQYASPVTVNLAANTATGIGGTWANIQVFIGTATTDTLIGPNANRTWSLTGVDAGTVGSVSFAGFGNLTGGTGNDVFQFSAGASVSGAIDGGAGTNTLNYSLDTSGVYVNLQTLAATGTAGIANFQNVTGSAVGGDILVGDGNNNVLTEIAGDNLVIGGGGGDTLTGGSGSDILIAGSTIYDQNVAALDALLAAWDNSSLSYALRVASLQSGVSYTDGTGTHTAALVADSTVSQPAGSGPSTLKGASSGLDWFFAAVTDVIKNQKKGEIVSPL